MSDKINFDRRRFLGTPAVGSAAQLAVGGIARAQSTRTNPFRSPAVGAASHGPFATVKQVHTGLLDVGYAEAGPSDGPPVVLLHGWPYDIHSYVDVAPLL